MRRESPESIVALQGSSCNEADGTDSRLLQGAHFPNHFREILDALPNYRS